MSKAKQGRIARHVRQIRGVCRDPRTAFPLLRGWLLGLWQARGGGFYGLGYVIAFVALETRTFAGNLGGSNSMSGFVAGQLVQYVLRISVESFVNAVLAFLWPLYALAWLGAWGLVVLVTGYFVFERGVRPSVEAWFPELREARARKARATSAADAAGAPRDDGARADASPEPAAHDEG